jgi:hypothetical protein
MLTICKVCDLRSGIVHSQLAAALCDKQRVIVRLRKKNCRPTRRANIEVDRKKVCSRIAQQTCVMGVFRAICGTYYP